MNRQKFDTDGYHILNSKGRAKTFVKDMTKEEKELDKRASKIIGRMCIRCLHRRARPGKKTCTECAEYMHNRRTNKGRCSRCGAKLPIGCYYKTCAKCRAYLMALKHNPQNCSLCGRKLPEGCMFKTCDKCREYMRNRRHGENRCPGCGGKTVGHQMCDRCKEYRSKRHNDPTRCRRCGKKLTGYFTNLGLCKNCKDYTDFCSINGDPPHNLERLKNGKKKLT